MLLAARLQLGVQVVLASLNGRTLTLVDERDRAGQFYTDLLYVQRALELAASRSGPDGSEPPSMTELQQHLDHDLNRKLADRAEIREELAHRRQAGELKPSRWSLTRHEHNGFFQAHLDNGDGLLGPVMDGWAPVPEAVPGLLRSWNTPSSRPLDLQRQCQNPWPPDHLLPYGGRIPGHRGHDDDHTCAPGEGLGELLWQEHQEAHRARFAAVMRQVQDAWPAGAGVADIMQERTLALNTAQPPAPSIDQLLSGTHHHDGKLGQVDLIGLGSTITFGWIDPAAVARVGSGPWNDFASHRPGTVPAMLAALLGDSLDEALRIWNLDGDHVRVVRIPGPAGPLYTLGANGAHRLTAARLARMPLVWARITQRALPLQLYAYEAELHRSHSEQGDVVGCWRGLLARGLVTGRLEENPTLPAMSILHLDDVAAAWLLASPKIAIAWAAAYDHTYPGALDELGVPASAWSDERSWESWLCAPPP
ncbi:hypothetical protein C1J01_10855 [Nonomuraea aridisoli]|uniref:Uncharacterized protein n=1 Tax=Nonomuraea aridisoli TaxID=2070368 RepID=A0A2W2EBT3_9ACTN|nr:hypothetical protein C1J01_10855 [Nonomuraea aridisoli]